jgi:hypothetical protein
MRNVVNLLVGLALVGAAVGIVVKVILPRLQQNSASQAPKPPPIKLASLPAEFVKRVNAAPDHKAAELLRGGRDQYDRPNERAELNSLTKERRRVARTNLDKQIESLVQEHRYSDAVRTSRRFSSAWGTPGPIDAIRKRQTDEVAIRKAEADALVNDGRYVAARESLTPPEGLFEAEAITQFAEHLDVVVRRIRVRSYRAAGHTPVLEVGPAQPPKKGRPSMPPALPGAPHADVKRIGEARALLARMAALFQAGNYGPLVKATKNLRGYFGDLAFVKRKRDSLHAILLFARYKSQGIKGLFSATESNLLGSAIRLVYRFETRAELFDWEQMKPIPHKSNGKFELVRSGVRGTGVAALVQRAYFTGKITLSCKSTPQKPESHGLAFYEAGNEQRQVILLATNHWFTEGENYVKKRAGHSILLIGKGVNNDVPSNTPDVGFVFKGPSRTKPSPPGGKEIELRLEFEDSRVKGEVRYRGTKAQLGVEARGDDGRGFERHRPALFVVEAGVVFREVEIRGNLHPSFARERERELLDLADAAFE